MMVLANAFSLNMLPADLAEGSVRVRKVSLEEARSLLAEGFTSAIGHRDTAVVLSNLLGLEVQENRVNVVLQPGKSILVAQYRGPRLPEGATALPEGATMEFFLVTLEG